MALRILAPHCSHPAVDLTFVKLVERGVERRLAALCVCRCGEPITITSTSNPFRAERMVVDMRERVAHLHRQDCTPTDNPAATTLTPEVRGGTHGS